MKLGSILDFQNQLQIIRNHILMKPRVKKGEPQAWQNVKFNFGLRALRRWIESISLKGIAAKPILLDTHYMYDMVNDMAELLDVIGKTKLTSFWQDDVTNTFVIISTMHTIKEVPIVWKGSD
jgi:hypothetical protein